MSYFPPHPNLLLRGSHGGFLIIPAGLQAPGLQRFAAFSGGLGLTAGALQFDTALRAAGRDGGMLAIRGFYNQWRFGDAASFTDQDLLKLLRRDVREGFLAAFYLPDEAFAGFTVSGVDDGQAVPAPSGPVSSWSVKQKLVAMFEDVPDDLGTAAQAEFRAFISPANLAIMAGILVTIAGVQAIPGADAFVDGLIIALAWAQLGWAGLLAARDFVEAVAQAGQAKSDDDIRLAAKLAAAALVSLGLVVFLKKLTGKVRQSGGLKGEETEDERPETRHNSSTVRKPSARTITNPDGYVKARISQLQRQIPDASKGRITMAVAVARDQDGAESVLVGTSEPRGYLRPGVSLAPGETMVPGTGHAEADIINYAEQNGLTVLNIGATRPVCGACQSLIPPATSILTPLK